MNKKDITQLKKAFGQAEDGPITRIASCYVNAAGNEIRYQDPALFSREEDEEADQYRVFLKKAITGKPGITSIEISPEENLLEDLRKSQLKDEELIRNVCENIKESYPSDEDYGIFMAYGVYDVPSGSQGDNGMDDLMSDEVYEFILVTIQPCTLSKAGIVYDFPSNNYKDRKKDRPLGAPMHSFLFPSFDEGHCDMSKAVYFSKNEKVQSEIHGTLNALFGADVPMTAQEQKDCFKETMEAGFGTSVPYDAVQKVYEKFSELRADAESSGSDAKLTTVELATIIKNSGDLDNDSEESIDQAVQAYTGRELSLDNIAPKTVNINTDTANVKIDLNDIPGVEVIEYKGQRCIVLPLYGANIDNLTVR